MINKHKYSIKNDKKLLHKIGKKWVVISAFLLMALGAAGATTTVNARAEEEANHTNNPVAESQVSNQASGGSAASGSHNTTTNSDAIMATSKTMHRNLMRLAADSGPDQSTNTTNSSQNSSLNQSLSSQQSSGNNHGQGYTGQNSALGKTDMHLLTTEDQTANKGSNQQQTPVLGAQLLDTQNNANKTSVQPSQPNVQNSTVQPMKPFTIPHFGTGYYNDSDLTLTFDQNKATTYNEEYISEIPKYINNALTKNNIDVTKMYGTLTFNMDASKVKAVTFLNYYRSVYLANIKPNNFTTVIANIKSKKVINATYVFTGTDLSAPSNMKNVKAIIWNLIGSSVTDTQLTHPFPSNVKFIGTTIPNPKLPGGSRVSTNIFLVDPSNYQVYPFSDTKSLANVFKSHVLFPIADNLNDDQDYILDNGVELLVAINSDNTITISDNTQNDVASLDFLKRPLLEDFVHVHINKIPPESKIKKDGTETKYYTVDRFGNVTRRYNSGDFTITRIKAPAQQPVQWTLKFTKPVTFIVDNNKALATLKGSDIDQKTHKNRNPWSSDIGTIDLSNTTINFKATPPSDFIGDYKNLKNIILGNIINGENATKLFANDNDLQSITVTSSDSKFNGRNNLPYGMYLQSNEKDPKGNYYTLPTPHNFMNGTNGPNASASLKGTFYKANNPTSDTIQYQYNNKKTNKTTNIGKPLTIKGYLDSNDWIYKVNVSENVPSDYHLAASDTVLEDGKTHDVAVSPNVEPDMVYYYYSDIKKPLKSVQVIKGNYGSDATSAINNPKNVPIGFTLDNKKHTTGIYTPKGAFYVQVTPSQVSDTINYQLNGKTLSSHVFRGNDYRSGVKSTTVTISNTNDPDIPTYYHVASDTNNTFEYDGQPHNVAIAPNTVNSTVNYSDANGNHIGSATINGPYDTSAKTAIDNNAPFNPYKYHVVSGDKVSYQPNASYNVKVAMNPVSNTVKFNDIYGNIDGLSAQLNLLDYKTKSDLPTSDYSVSAPNSKWVLVNPNGTLVNGNEKFNYGTNQTVDVAPVYDGLTYKYDKNNNSIEFINGTINTNDLSNFSSNNSLVKGARSITFDNGINTSKVTNMSGMFKGDSDLNTINFGNSFDTSHVTNMSDMFENDHKLQALTLSNAFDTGKVTDFNNMFSDTSIKSLTINSPKTTLASNAKTKLPYLYQQSSDKNSQGDFYTSAKPNDFTKGNLGTFVKPAILKPDTIIYQDKDNNNKQVGNPVQLTGLMDPTNGEFQVDISKNVPANYHLNNQNDITVVDNGGTYDVEVLPNNTKGLVIYSDSDYPAGKTDIYTLQLSDTGNTSQEKSHVPNGYVLKNKDIDGVIVSDGSYHIQIRPQQVTDTINYQYDGTTQASHKFTGNNYLTGVNGTFIVNSVNDPGIPRYYHITRTNMNPKVPRSYRFNYDGQTHNVPIKPDDETSTVYYEYGSDANPQQVGLVTINGSYDASAKSDIDKGCS